MLEGAHPSLSPILSNLRIISMYFRVERCFHLYFTVAGASPLRLSSTPRSYCYRPFLFTYSIIF